VATERDDLTIEVPDEALPEEGSSRLSELQLALARDTSDDRLAPRRGSRLLVEAKGADEGLHSDFSYGTVELVASRYLPLGGDRVLAFRLRGGLAAPRGDTKLPVQRRLYGGGPTSLRSYLRRTVGPLDSEGNGIGGEVAVELVAEWRVPLVWRLSGVLFAELGEVWGKIDAVRIASLNSGAGTGLRVATPVGPIRLDVGWKLSDFDPELNPIAVHVSIGEAF
jgi:outer membrane protein insertion porin family